MFESISVPRIFRSGDPEKECPFRTARSDITNIRECRRLTSGYGKYLRERFQEGYSAETLLKCRTDFVDTLLRGLFEHFGLNQSGNLALLAVGGYGRGELFPASDIDIFIVYGTAELTKEDSDKIGRFISYLWDIKMDLGSAVRSISEAVTKARSDITIKTNLLENRLIAGSADTYARLQDALDTDDFWTPKAFLRAKISEQLRRCQQYRNTVYSIEPDIKNNPGGMRDLQLMQWLAAVINQTPDFASMYRSGLLTSSEFTEILECRRFLCSVRYALHCIYPDNRLTLDLQKGVAELLGYGSEGNKPVETMMRGLFRTFRRIRELCTIVIQLETLAVDGHQESCEFIFLNSSFVQRGTLIDVIDPELFNNNPSKILELFYIISRRQSIEGIHVNCIRALRESRRHLRQYLIEFPACRSLFRQILCSPGSLLAALPLMHEFRILPAYMPQWEHIEGLTQFDMFHVYSVDEHTIRVLKNFRLLNEARETIFNLFRNAFRRLSEPELLLTAGFLHDIAKGRGGHHSEKGEAEARNFCALHHFAPYQTEMVAWCVRHHLLFSTTATRRDITDPAVIENFAATVRDEEHLNMLYCLTVSDICATNEREWTSWKDNIFRQLYFTARQALRQGGSAIQDTMLKAQEKQQIIIENEKYFKKSELLRYFAHFPMHYFIYYAPSEIIWHAHNILRFRNSTRPLILFSQLDKIWTELLIYFRSSSPMFFGSVTLAMTLKKLNVFSGQVFLTHDFHLLCTIKFQTQKGTTLDNDRLHSLRKAILTKLSSTPKISEVPVVSVDRSKIFNVPTKINFLKEGGSKNSCLEISALDSSGLLAKICITLGRCGCLIAAARVTTSGEKANDFFTITDVNGMPLDDARQQELLSALHAALDEPPAVPANQEAARPA